MTNTGPSIGRRILEKEVLGQSSGRSAFWQGPGQILSLIIAFALGMISSVLVDGCRLSARRAAMSEAFLQHIKFCGTRANQLAGNLTDLITKWKDPKAEDLPILSFIPVDSSFWHAGLRDIEALPTEHIPRLVRFYDLLERGNVVLNKINLQMADLKEQARREGKKGTSPPNDIKESIIKNAENAKVIFLKDLAPLRNASSLYDVPAVFPSEDTSSTEPKQP
ncbi:MAG TPA: hypothetical protein VFH53_10050 [Phycisphaerae bacterium]|nr:hypothetical protein [Phycisphaerae bacterium]